MILRNKYKTFLTLTIFHIWVISCIAQDIHFSQYYFSTLNLNPALTGAFQEDIRFSGNFRNQWQQVPVDYLNFSASVDMKVFDQLIENGLFGVGLLLNTDKAGDANLGSNQVFLNVNYIHRLNTNLFLSAGFQGGLINRGFEAASLTFNNNWNGDSFQADLDNRESFQDNSINYLDLSGGINLHYQMEDFRTKVDFGTAIFHINQSAVGYTPINFANLDRKINVYTNAAIMLNSKMDVLINAIWQKQTPYKEILAGAYFKYYLNTQKYNLVALSIGSSYRFGDALIPGFIVNYQSWQMGFSYDINISDFNAATNGNGGPELSLQYVITKVKPLSSYKSCPIF